MNNPSHKQLLIATILSGFIANGRTYEMKEIYKMVDEIIGMKT